MRYFIVFTLLFSFQIGNAQTARQKGKALIDSAKVYMIKRPEKAIAICKGIIQDFGNTDSWVTGRAYAIGGRAFQNTSKKDSAIAFYVRGLHAFNEADTSDFHTQYFLCRNTASILHSYELFEFAQIYYDRSLFFLGEYLERYPDIAMEDGDFDKYDLVNYYSVRNRLDNLGVLKGAEKLRFLGEDSTQSPEIRAKAMNYLGVAYKKAEMFDSASFVFQRLFRIKGLSPKNRAVALHNYAGIYITQGDYEKAIELLDTTIKLKLTIDNKRSFYLSLIDKGEAEMRAGKYPKAEHSFMMALELDLKIAVSEELFVIYHYLSIVMSNLNKPDEAEHWASLYRQVIKENLVTDSDHNFLAWQERIKTALESTLKELEYQDKLNQVNERSIRIVSLLLGLVSVLIYSLVAARKFLQKKHRRKVRKLEQDINTVILSDISTEDLYKKPK